MLNIDYLPFEIIEEIDNYLTIQDRYQLVFLNHTFYSLFIRLLYRTITIETKKEWDNLIFNFQMNQHNRYVYHLKILWKELREIDLKRLQVLCPHVQSIHVDWRIWDSIERYTAQSDIILIDFISTYGASTLSSLTLDIYHMTNPNPVQLLCHTPHLRSLKLMGINKTTNVSYSLLEGIHHACPLLEQLSIEADTTDLSNQTLPDLKTNSRLQSFELKTCRGTDRFSQWLPYLGSKYPQLRQLTFEHLGATNDMIEPSPPDLYRLFFQRCRHLTDLHLHNLAPDPAFLTLLPPLQSLTLQDRFLLTIFHQPNLRQLTLEPIPACLTPNSLMINLGRACPGLTDLSLSEPQIRLANPFRLDQILDHLPRLRRLRLKQVPVRLSYPASPVRPHPLERLALDQCAVFEGIFDHLASRCQALREVGCVRTSQRDRRFRVEVGLGEQVLERVELGSLRTERFEVERRIRFFRISQEKKVEWYYMKTFVKEERLERAVEWVVLSLNEVVLLTSLLKRPVEWAELELQVAHFLKCFPQSIVAEWNAKDIYDAGYVDFKCKSVKHLYINKKKIKSFGC